MTALETLEISVAQAGGGAVTASIPGACVRSDMPVGAGGGGRIVLSQVAGETALLTMMRGDDLVISTPGRGALVLAGYARLARSGAAPAIQLADGTVIGAADAVEQAARSAGPIALESCVPEQTAAPSVPTPPQPPTAAQLAQIPTAAGAAQLAQIATAAGPNLPVPGGEAASGARFNSKFAPTPFDGMGYNPVSALAFGPRGTDFQPGGQELEPPQAQGTEAPAPAPAAILLAAGPGAGKEDLGDPAKQVAAVAPPAAGEIAVPLIFSGGSVQEVPQVLLTGVPAGVRFNLGTAGPGGSWLIENATVAALAGLRIVAVPPESDRDFTVQVSATVLQPGIEQPQVVTAVMAVVLDAVADIPLLTAPDYQLVVAQTAFGAGPAAVGVAAAQTVAVGQTGLWTAISGESPDDGSESVTLAVGKSAGEPAGITVDATDPNALSLTFAGGPAGFSGPTLRITGTATATETASDDNPDDNVARASLDRVLTIAYRPIVDHVDAPVRDGAVQTVAAQVPQTTATMDIAALLAEERVDHSGQANVVPADTTLAAAAVASVDFRGEGAAYRNIVGWYQIDSAGQVTAPQLIWTDASAAADGALNNVLGTDNPGFMLADVWGNAQSTYQALNGGAPLPAGTSFGFFVLADGANDAATIAQLTAAYADRDALNASGLLHFVNEGGILRLAFDSDGNAATAGDTRFGDGFALYFSHDPALNSDASGFALPHFAAGISGGGGTLLHFGAEDISGGGDLDYNDVVFSLGYHGSGVVGGPILVDPVLRLADADAAGFGNLERVTFTLADALRPGETLVGADPALLASLGLQQAVADGGRTLVFTAAGAPVAAEAYEQALDSVQLSVSATLGTSGMHGYTVTAADADGLIYTDAGAMAWTVANTLRIDAGSLDLTQIAKLGRDFDPAAPLAPIDNVLTVDMANGNANTLGLGLDDVMALTDQDLPLAIHGDASDRLVLHGPTAPAGEDAWVRTAGAGADTYTWTTAGDVVATLVVDHAITVQHQP